MLAFGAGDPSSIPGHCFGVFFFGFFWFFVVYGLEVYVD
jgi:hypothetical protein